MINEPSQEQLHQLPAYGANEEETADDILIHGHFFLPAGRFDWYVAEYDGQDTFFGFVNLNDPPNAEWGPFRLSELRELRISVPLLDGQTREQLARLPIEVEWDEHWQLCQFRKIALLGR